MSTLHVLLFGQLAVRKDGESLVVFPSQRSQELLCYLLLHRNQALPRESLFDLFWKDSPPPQARRNLRQTLWQLQRAISHGPAGSALISASVGSVQIDPACDMRTDVGAFEQAFEPVRGVPGEQLSHAQAGALKAAVELYRGDLLEGWYQEWCLIERERLQIILLAMLDKLMGFFEAHQSYEAGIGYGEQALRFERSNERTHRHLMRLLYLSGERAAALRQYERCAASLREELDVEPSAATTELYRQIRVGSLAGPGGQQPAALPPPAARDDTPLLEVRERLQRLWDAVAAIQAELQENLKLVERAIGERRR